MKPWFVILCVGSFLFGCGRREKPDEPMAITPVATIDEVASIVGHSDEGLVAFDFYANWCGPCRSLAPVLESVAQENKSRIVFYRINIDNVPQAAQLFKVDRIPYVIFVRNRAVVAQLTGIQPKEKYVAIISAYSVKRARQDSLADST